MEDNLIVIPCTILHKELELKSQINDINKKIKELEVIESKINNREYLLTSDVNKTINVKDFLDNLITIELIESTEMDPNKKNEDGTLDYKEIVEVRPNGYKPGDTIKFYLLNKEYGYLQPDKEFKFKEKFFKKYNLAIEDEYKDYIAVCNYFSSLKSKLLYDYCQNVYFTVNDNKNMVTKLVI